MNTTTSLVLEEAVSGTGMVKSGILSAIRSWRLSGAHGELVQSRIESAELHRELAETRKSEQRVADLRALLDDMREQRDRWQAQADRLSSVLTDQKGRHPDGGHGGARRGMAPAFKSSTCERTPAI